MKHHFLISCSPTSHLNFIARLLERVSKVTFSTSCPCWASNSAAVKLHLTNLPMTLCCLYFTITLLSIPHSSSLSPFEHIFFSFSSPCWYFFLLLWSLLQPQQLLLLCSIQNINMPKCLVPGPISVLPSYFTQSCGITVLLSATFFKPRYL